MNSHNFIKKPPVHSLGGRPPKFTRETKTVLLDALRSGKSYASACLAAGISPVALFMWRRAHFRFDSQCRNARARGKRKPLAMRRQWTQIDLHGNIVPNSGIVADEKERCRLIRLRERLHGLTRDEAPKRLSRRRENCHDEVVKRLLELREDYEAEERRKTEAEIAQIARRMDKIGGQRELSDSKATPQFTYENRVRAQLVEPLIVTENDAINPPESDDSPLPEREPPPTTPRPPAPVFGGDGRVRTHSLASLNPPTVVDSNLGTL